LSWYRGIIAKWKELERRQKIGIIAVAALVLLALGIAIFLLANPRMVVLTTASDGIERNTITTALDAQNIRHREDGLRIMVPEADLWDAQTQYTMSSNVDLEGFTFEDALAAGGLTASARMIDESLIRAKESQLARQLLTIEGITAAQVILGIPRNNSLWMPTEEERTASVILTTNNRFNKNIGKNLSMLITSGVEELKRENVTIMDQNGEPVWLGEVSEDGVLDSQNEYRAALSTAIVQKVREVLSPAFKELRISANLVIDFAKFYEETTKLVNPVDPESSQGVVLSQELHESSSEGVETAAEPGPAANQMVTYPVGGTGNMASETADSITTFGYDQIRNISDSGQTGRILIDDSSVSVTAVNFDNYYEDEFNSGAYAEISDAGSWRAFKDSVETRSVDTDQQYIDHTVTASGISNISILSLRQPVFHDLEPSGIRTNEVLMLAVMALVIMLLAYGLLKRQKPEEITDLEPELAVEDLLVSTQIEEEKEQEMQEDERLREIKLQQDSETKQQIEKFINLRPEAAAQLLRNWLNEDWD
jgi:flagellar M-ring protein FliF